MIFALFTQLILGVQAIDLTANRLKDIDPRILELKGKQMAEATAVIQGPTTVAAPHCCIRLPASIQSSTMHGTTFCATVLAPFAHTTAGFAFKSLSLNAQLPAIFNSQHSCLPFVLLLMSLRCHTPTQTLKSHCCSDIPRCCCH